MTAVARIASTATALLADVPDDEDLGSEPGEFIAAKRAQPIFPQHGGPRPTLAFQVNSAQRLRTCENGRGWQAKPR